MAVTYENSVAKHSDFASSVTQSFDSGTNENRCVIVFAGTDRGGATTINSATYGGVSMTAHTGFNHGSGYDGRMFYLAGAASGANNIVVTYSDGNAKPKMVAVAYSGVDQTTPLENLTNVTPNIGAAMTATVSSETGDLVGLIGIYLSGTATPESPAVERYDAQMSTSGFYGFVWEEAGASSVTINGTIGASSESWATAYNINAAAGATGVPATNRLLMGVG